MKRKLTLIFIAFCTSFITMVSLSLFSIERFVTFTDYSDEVLRSNHVIRMLYKTEVFLKDMDRWERGFILTNDTTYLKVVHNVIDSIYPALDGLEHMVGSNPAQTKNILFLRKNIVARINLSIKNINYVDSTNSNDASPYYFEGRKYMLASIKIMNDMHVLENNLLSQRFKKQQFYEQLTTNTLKSLLFIFCIITLVLFVLLMKLIRSGMLYQEELQGKVIDLKRSHGELQDIAYSISHDLQEPLRKIQIFSNMLLFRKSGGNDDDSKNTLQRINSSASRMQSLITDLVSLTNLTNMDENKSPVDLNRIVEHTIIDINSKIKEKGAIVDAEKLPIIFGYETQLKILVKALLDNALKFSKQDVKPEIKISYRVVTGSALAEMNPSLQKQQFYCVSISDNGIGFDNKYITNIFRIFRRLHTEQSEYEGKGVGLAICQRIMANHEGYILGEGVPAEGAVFRLYFPYQK
jgi:signal transduction histidine kinase